jgi:hypothetical protein
VAAQCEFLPEIAVNGKRAFVYPQARPDKANLELEKISL